jgi:hypothetical protein
MKSSFRISLMAILLFSAALWGVDSGFADSPQTLGCVTSGLTQGVLGPKIVDGHEFFVRRMAIIFDDALDDFGETGFGDELEIFCVSRTSSDEFGHLAMCLSNESCPWR